MAFQFGAIAPVAPIVEHRFGANLADIGFLIGLYFVPGIAIAVPGGTISALFGDRRAVAAGIVLMLAGAILAVFANAWPVLICARLLAGVGGVLINVLMTKLVADWFVGREISTAMAIYVNSWPVGIALALLILPPMTAWWSLTLAWTIIPLLISAGLLLFLSVYRAPTGLKQAPGLGMATRIPFALVILAGSVWALFNCAIVMVFSFGPVLLHQRGWSLTASASVTSLFLIFVAISVPLGGIIADRTGRPDHVIVAGTLGFAVLLMVVLALPLSASPFLFALMGLIGGAAAGPIVALPTFVLKPETRAFGMGVFYTVYYGAVVLMPPLAGSLADRWSNAGATFLLGTILLLGGLGALWRFRRFAAAAVPIT